MTIDDAQLKAEIEGMAKQLTALADGLANDGLLGASGLVLASVQTIRVLYTRLYAPPAKDEPKLQAVPNEAG